jgi:hypothetical protein
LKEEFPNLEIMTGMPGSESLLPLFAFTGWVCYLEYEFGPIVCNSEWRTCAGYVNRPFGVSVSPPAFHCNFFQLLGSRVEVIENGD